LRTAIDTNVISALWSAEPTAPQMMMLLEDSRQQGGLVICAAVYAELLAYPGATESFVDTFLKDADITVDFAIEEPIWRMAAKSFAAYARKRRLDNHQTKRLLVDFIVGAHAAFSADRLLTLDAARYQDLTTVLP
jgi:predicted nucleic acid-binding protein